MAAGASAAGVSKYLAVLRTKSRSFEPWPATPARPNTASDRTARPPGPAKGFALQPEEPALRADPDTRGPEPGPSKTGRKDNP
ncbi:hypothetical protein M885DRAFT_504098 [Pelagophyceae sp. CCMP2097]|nr:hypothetical protein M885DRAFT_504098 [Pelagophyceae sp. CCMP2097]